MTRLRFIQGIACAGVSAELANRRSERVQPRIKVAGMAFGASVKHTDRPF